MKTKKKALLMTLCAVMLVVASVMGTMAYLTSQDSVTNTFTVGSIAITLDETDVDDSTPNAERDKANAYHLLPGHSYVKDPTVHVAAGSENSFVFVKVENGISEYEAATVTDGYQAIADQISANGWTALNGVSNVYYKEYTKNESAVTDFKVFDNFKIATDANNVNGWGNITPTSTTIKVTAYAVQKDGFDSAEEAWTAALFS